MLTRVWFPIKCAAFGAALASTSAAALAADIAVVANHKFPVATISIDDVRELYLGKARELTGVGVVQLVDQPGNSALKDEFAQKVLDKTPSQLNAYWSVRIFTGHGVPPQSVGDEHAVKAWLAAHPDGIAYIDLKQVDSSVKVLLKVQ